MDVRYHQKFQGHRNNRFESPQQPYFSFKSKGTAFFISARNIKKRLGDDYFVSVIKTRCSGSAVRPTVREVLTKFDHVEESFTQEHS